MNIKPIGFSFLLKHPHDQVHLHYSIIPSTTLTLQLIVIEKNKMVAITKFLWLALAATVTTATAIVRRDVITVQNDITQKLGPSLNTLNNDVNGFPKSGLSGAVAIQGDIASVVSVLERTVSDIKSTGQFGTVSGTTILADIQVLVIIYLASLVNIANQAPSWHDIQGGQALILGQLRSWNTATTHFLDAIISSQPLLLKAGGLAIKAQLTGAFTTAIAAYS
jgi:ethanolamine utilization microcompartment shell protein EutS